MRRKSSGVAVAAVLVGVAVAAVVYIASFGRSRHAEAPVPATSTFAAQEAASAAAFGDAPRERVQAPAEQTAAK
jgi:hypothetical protein